MKKSGKKILAALFVIGLTALCALSLGHLPTVAQSSSVVPLTGDQAGSIAPVVIAMVVAVVAVILVVALRIANKNSKKSKRRRQHHRKED